MIHGSKPSAMWGQSLHATLKFSDLPHWSVVYSPCGVWWRLFTVTQKATWADIAAYCRQAWDKQGLHSLLLISPWKASVSERETTPGHLSHGQPLPARQLLSFMACLCVPINTINITLLLHTHKHKRADIEPYRTPARMIFHIDIACMWKNN